VGHSRAPASEEPTSRVPLESITACAPPRSVAATLPHGTAAAAHALDARHRHARLKWLPLGRGLKEPPLSRDVKVATAATRAQGATPVARASRIHRCRSCLGEAVVADHALERSSPPPRSLSEPPPCAH
jgi:hypothetical protein